MASRNFSVVHLAALRIPDELLRVGQGTAESASKEVGPVFRSRSMHNSLFHWLMTSGSSHGAGGHRGESRCCSSAAWAAQSAHAGRKTTSSAGTRCNTSGPRLAVARAPDMRTSQLFTLDWRSLVEPQAPGPRSSCTILNFSECPFDLPIPHRCAPPGRLPAPHPRPAKHTGNSHTWIGE